MARGEKDQDSNRTLLSGYIGEIIRMETPSESLKHLVDKPRGLLRTTVRGPEQRPHLSRLMSARENREEEFSESEIAHDRSHSLHGSHLGEGVDYVEHSGVEEESRQEVQPLKPPGQNFRWYGIRRGHKRGVFETQRLTEGYSGSRFKVSEDAGRVGTTDASAR